ncbi:MAG TPA: hypothetical protein PKY77_13705 [Phycisphaerae bacterium]|nr:hypothetical protein [Phycisphaerae bacterium]HRY70508.1 hypothetical protein [Phycisphaerae bacterium]HSA28237.1 hypothetical protein [Phycisphaerae bacterium]
MYRVLTISSTLLLMSCVASAAGQALSAPTARVKASPVKGPADLPDDPTIWPNKTCFRASEPWLVENHTRIRKMQPRVLVLNFANDVEMSAIKDQTEKFIKALAESSRYHGYQDPKAPAFLDYRVVKYVDLRDEKPAPDMAKSSSTLFPVLPSKPADMWCDYKRLYTEEFAKYYGFEDPSTPGRHLDLKELIQAGIVHELWFYCIHDHKKGWPAFEVIELKQYYDKDGRPIPGKHGKAGNGGEDDTMPWTGHSFRIYFFNPHRGVGCQLENFGHLLEGHANHDTIAYHTKYFREFAGLDWDKRHKLPFKSLYEMSYDREKCKVTYPSENKIIMLHEGKEYSVAPFDVFCGSNHWPPGARYHYDLDSPNTVECAIENYRLRNGPPGKDKLTEFNIKMTEQYRAVAPDCMGRWIVYWCQSMPGLDNNCIDDDGRPMKNWWVYLFY